MTVANARKKERLKASNKNRNKLPKIRKLTEHDRYLGMKWDKDHNQLPQIKEEEFEELRKKYEEGKNNLE